MKLSKHLLAGLVAVTASASSMAGTILSEGFDDISTLGVKGWSQQNLSVPTGVINWFQGNPLVFSASSGAVDSYIAGNFNSGVIGSGNTISNWLMTPVVDINKTVRMNFDLRLEGSGFLDTVEIYYSTSGISTSIADFILLNTYSNAGPDTGWVNYTATLGSVIGNNTGRFAFRYFVADTATDGNYIGIDSVNIVPEPASLGLVGLALAGAAAARRRKTAA